ncbi:MAG: hypothetical protein MZW92_45885 [Comamonadaceae bacterium]|nr:hypothetical protein [Comamonadaceae bacterium]
MTSGTVAIRDDRAAVELRFSARDRAPIGDYYRQDAKSKRTPPGLAKREQLPPGLARGGRAAARAAGPRPARRSRATAHRPAGALCAAGDRSRRGAHEAGHAGGAGRVVWSRPAVGGRAAVAVAAGRSD